MSYQERRSVPGSEPYLRGHFAGNPVVPAVIILEMVLEAIRRWKVGVDVSGVPYAKFRAPLPPDVSFTIDLRELGDCAIGFECRRGDLVFAQGKADLATPARIA